jgi:alpha-tubulin suppressor-like RCC1 family protein
MKARGRLVVGVVVAACATVTLGALPGAIPAGASTPRARAGASLSAGSVVQLAAGHGSACGVLWSGRVECWGWGVYGQLGRGTANSSPRPALVRGLDGVRQVAVGFAHACALLRSGHVACWGWNDNGQLGDATRTTVARPVVVPGLAGVRQLSLGFAHSCALLRTGTARCWGWNFNGQLGDGTFASRWLPTPVRGLRGIRAIAAGFAHTCAIVAGGGVRCWGDNGSGQLGDGTTRSSRSPVVVRGLRGVRQLAVSFADSCAVLADRRVACWGRNNYGQLGDGSTATSLVPTVVRDLGRAAQVTVGYGHACALQLDGLVRCWGWNGHGQLGTGGFGRHALRPLPVRTSRLRGVVALAAQDDGTCALLGVHVFSCWGWNADGELGVGSRRQTPRPPFLPTVPGSASAVAGDTTAEVQWTPPAQHGAAAVTRYDVRAVDESVSSHGGQSCSRSIGPRSCVVTGLTNGDRYAFTVRASSVVGAGPPLRTSDVVPAAVPFPPTDVVATPADGTATVSWVAPANDGGYPVTSFVATARDATAVARGRQRCAPTALGVDRCTLHELTNGDDYTFTVTATNAIGTSLPSAPSTDVTPFTRPDAPLDVSGTSEDGASHVSWSAPAFDGGAAITGYAVQATDSTTPANGGQSCTTAGSLACAVSGLTNGDAYTFTVTATNPGGTSPASAASAAVTPATTPGAPTDVTGDPGDASVAVSWSAPDFDGGAAVSAYTVTAIDTTTPANGNQQCGWVSGALACTVSGLTNGDDYTFEVTATNRMGTGPAATSADVTPATVPDAPTGVVGTPGVASASVTWQPPDTDGGSAITSYTVTATDTTSPGNGGQTCTGTSGPAGCDVTGLATGDVYTFTVVATNERGDGPASAPSDPLLVA